MTQQLLNDVNHWVGGDITVSPTGDLGLASADLRTQQRIVRRLVTNPGDYIFHTDYGAGLPQKIGETLDVPALRGLIRSQILQEAGVAQDPEPQVDVAAITGGVSVRILYSSAVTREPVSLQFNVSK
ncbi:phage tail protein [Ralstonia sp. 22086]|jgi:phage baseplate assembly protein W|uniref:phage tail protein n=1 Tax=Ralstonia TaxID=48736 RepID=UPI002AAD97D5|nr:phage tail protein [Ralstonia wenshanensis]MDY7510669.1 phage tail protein [Ralstonia wenshanensis]